MATKTDMLAAEDAGWFPSFCCGGVGGPRLGGRAMGTLPDGSATGAVGGTYMVGWGVIVGAGDVVG